MIMQEAILLFFQRISNPFLDTLAQAVTMCGELAVSIVLICTVLWCLNKRKALAICSTMLTALAAMGALKAIVRYPRPWLVIEGLDSSRLETATGYSFPSGHTTTAASMYGSLSKAYRKRWLSILCAVLILLVGLSRNYLRVHWPMDVVGGWILGLGASLVLYDRLYSILGEKGKARVMMLAYFIVGTISALLMAILLDAGKIDETAFMDLMKNMAFVGGGFLGALLESRYVGFDASKGGLLKKLLRLAIGIGIVILIKSLGSVLPELAILDMARYFLLAIAAIFGWPWLGMKIGLFEKAD
jgi:membrane-associated phospholipid phosphatase